MIRFTFVNQIAMRQFVFFIFFAFNISAQSDLRDHVIKIYKLDNNESNILTNTEEFEEFINRSLYCTALDNKSDSIFSLGGLIGTFRFKKNGTLIFDDRSESKKSKGSWYFTDDQLIINIDKLIAFRVVRLQDHLLLESEIKDIHLHL
jgi:hypothetical protein